jgi:hypothetical protein
VVSSAQFLIDSETNLQAAMQSMIGMPGMDMKGGGGSKAAPQPKATPTPSPDHGSMPGMDMGTPSTPSPAKPGAHKSHQG